MIIIFVYFLTVSLTCTQEVSDETFTEVYVKQSGDDRNSGTSIGQEVKSLHHAYSQLGNDIACKINVVHDATPLIAEKIECSKDQGIIIEGVKSDGSCCTEVAVDCDDFLSSISYASLFNCKKSVEFKHLAFRFSITEHKWYVLIGSSSNESSLVINNCKFVRVGMQSQGGIAVNVDGNSFVAARLVQAYYGKVEMNSVSCTDETSFVTFEYNLFDFNEAKEVILNGVEISKVNVERAAVSIKDSGNSIRNISIEGLNVQDVNSESGVAGLDITCELEGSIVSIGRKNKCTFKSCSVTSGRAGAICIFMMETVSFLKLPLANNLEIDSSNNANSTSRSLFLIAPDFESFCEQKDSFEFADEFNESAVGWILATKDSDFEPVDAYEKFIKVRHEKQKNDPEAAKKDNKKKAGTIVAIVVPIAVVVVTVVVVVAAVIVIRKRKSKSGKEKH
ncbi:uncharacterized protein MONOS_4663 [Monocercomonoides exilis]|uniref:uncharacterized protein n=1 Tax=Monocercomonoides exilis TaxID=2049356 RepID=UPI00355A212D|nr:hypothetical protein MONOS_4663 [Monocercomonoides exilis]|eukprot:MONOS_4663.1-p1 / transcript=MONOS_4663.1 / gene=MONOS_4663 / organism=Monocercomonoides_exilis_PA203 / gene_product=unspecified product / transcript_product=unspecified product / location=Mono_scaffold00126:70345-71691(-) / protein_length=449 / sequence_SO=supercontig / SO=protein_coding / is_pseudo=false